VWICSICFLSFVEGIPHSVFISQGLASWETVLKGVVHSAITSSFILCKKYALAYGCMSSYDLSGASSLLLPEEHPRQAFFVAGLYFKKY